MKEHKYRVGDWVRIKHFEDGLDEDDYAFTFAYEMEEMAGRKFKIKSIEEDDHDPCYYTAEDDGCLYRLEDDGKEYNWASSMFEPVSNEGIMMYESTRNHYTPNFNI